MATLFKAEAGVLETATLRVCRHLEHMMPRRGWQEYEETSLWHELVSCLLGSRVPFELAQTAAQHLVAADLLDPQHYFRNSDDFETQIMKALSKPVCLPLTHSGRLRAYVYPRLKARQITLSVESLYSGSGSIRSILESSLGSRHARQGIMSVTTGIGPKQSSLFLRNIGYAHDLAILDRHVLEYMNLLGIFPRGMNDVSTLPRYESAEDRLREYSDGLGTTPAELDTAIWVVMRVFERKVHP